MKKIYNTPVAYMVAISSVENLLAGSVVAPADIYDSYTDADALSNGRLDEWDDED